MIQRQSFVSPKSAKTTRAPGRIRVAAALLLGVVLLLTTTHATQSSASCPDVGFMPRMFTRRGAKDQPPQEIEDEQYGELLDYHTFNHFHTFQLDRDVGEDNEGVEMFFPARLLTPASSEGFAFRLRAEYNSADSTHSEMGLKVSLLQENKSSSIEDQNDRYTVIADASSLGEVGGEGTVSLDVPKLSHEHTYKLVYNFYQKESFRKGNSLSVEEDTTTSGDALVQCNLSFFTQELVLVDRKVLAKRVRKYNQSDRSEEKNLKKEFYCDFGALDASGMLEGDVEGGLECMGQTYTFEGQSNGKDLHKIAEFPFKVAGVGNRPITQYFQADVGSEFAFGAGLKVLLRRTEGSKLSNSQDLHAFACLLDKSCQLATKSHKNHHMLNVVLTSGDYILEIYDYQKDDFRQWLADDLDLTETPFELSVSAVPILQNDVRSTCPYMYLSNSFIQDKYVNKQDGQRFVFSDKIIMNLSKQEQRIELTPERDSFLKVTMQESFGVNASIQICKHGSSKSKDYDDDLVCFDGQKSSQVGTVEILHTSLQKHEQIVVKIDFSHSIVAMHSFKTCPHINLELSMISHEDFAELDNQPEESKGMNREMSEKNLGLMFGVLQGGITELHLTDPDNSRFNLESHVDQAFEVLSTQKIKVAIKMGIFIEIFSSPFQDEVLELFIKSDDNDELDKNRQDQKFSLTEYKTSKVIWAELEAGEYTVDIVALRQVKHDKVGTGKTELVSFQLYLIYDMIKTSREVFLPDTLNYHGLLGYEGETKDFGEVILFYDDLSLYHPVHRSMFRVQSEIASFSMQVQENKKSVKPYLYSMDSDGKWTRVGEVFEDVSKSSTLHGVHLDRLQKDTEYRIELHRDSQVGHTDSVELGDDHGSSFSVKIVFSEYDEKSRIASLKSAYKEKLPVSFEQIAMTRKTVPSIKTQSFLMGSREMLGLFDQEVTSKSAFEPKACDLWASHKTSDLIVTSVPFTVKNFSEAIYVGLYDYTDGSSLVSVAIFDSETEQEVVVSRQGKYFQSIEMTTLTKGDYFLVVRNDRADSSLTDVALFPLRFQIDVVRYSIEKEDFWSNEIMEAIQFCPLPTVPTSGITKVGYLHSLNGGSIDTNFKVSNRQLDFGSIIPLKLTEKSLVTFYVESDDTPIAVQISENGGMRKTVTQSNDQDSDSSNFLKQAGYVDKKVVQVREFLAPGNYWIQISSINFHDTNVSYDEKADFCKAYSIGLSVSPLKSASQRWQQDVNDVSCEDPQLMPQHLIVGTLTQGIYRTDSIKLDRSISYFDTSNSHQEGPFLVWFQMEYDVRSEGVLGVVLFKFDPTANIFTELGLYEAQDGQSMILKVVEVGTYAISVQSIASTPAKYLQLGLSQAEQREDNYFVDKCFEAQYTYFINTFNSNDESGHAGGNNLMEHVMNSMFGQMPSLQHMMSDVLTLEANDDLKNLNSFQACEHQVLPKEFPESVSGFDKQYTLKVQDAAFDIVDLVIDEPSLVRVFIDIQSPGNEVEAFLVDHSKHPSNEKRKAEDASLLQRFNPDFNQDEDESPFAWTDSVDHSFTTVVQPTEQAYHLKIVYSKLDTSDACPLFTLRVAVKPLDDLEFENLECSEASLPPTEYNINTPDFKTSSKYAFTQEFLEWESNGEMFNYDIIVQFPHPEYYLDVELKSDFLTTDIDLSLLTQHRKSDIYHLVAVSELADYNSLQDAQVLATEDMGSQPLIRRLRFFDDDETLKHLSTATNIMIRLTVKKDLVYVVDELIEQEIVEEQTPLCFNFELSISARDESLDNPQTSIYDSDGVKTERTNKLIRVNWQPNPAEGNFSTSKELMAVIEFEFSVAGTLSDIQNLGPNGIYLTPSVGGGFGANQVKGKVSPFSMRLHQNDDRTLIVYWKPNLLLKGTCYDLKFNKNFPIKNLMPQSMIEQLDDLKLCTSGCNCDPLGTAKCVESAGEADDVCQCHHHYTGVDCGQCEEGYTKNEQGYCVLESVCQAQGGDVHCSGHGECNQKGSRAVCDCDPGFADDGRQLCGRCADPAMRYPHECAETRSWILSSNIQCDLLPYVMPRVLYETKRVEGESHDDDTIYQQDNGQAQWTGRFGLRNAESDKWKFEDHSSGGRDIYRETSEHKFIVPATSQYRIYLNTLNSNAKVRYSIFNIRDELIVTSEHFKGQVTEFDQIKPLEQGKLAKDSPYTLKLEFEYEIKQASTSGMTENECPVLEVHFVVQPLHFAQSALKCDKSELNAASSQDITTDFKLGASQVTSQKIVMNSGMKVGKGAAISEEDAQFEYVIATFEATDSDNALTIIAGFEFENMYVFLDLYDLSNNRLINTEKSGILDHIETEQQKMVRTMMSRGSDFKESAVAESGQHDMMSYIEIPRLQAGKYQLKAAIPKGNWVWTREYETCLAFELTIEHFVRATRDLNEQWPDDDKPYQIISVYPPKTMNIPESSTMTIRLTMDRVIDTTQLIKVLPEFGTMCRLQSMVEEHSYMIADNVWYRDDAAQFDFSFAKYEYTLSGLRQKGGEDANCYKLWCEKNDYLEPITETYKYCFRDDSKKHTNDSPSDEEEYHVNEKCNPFSKAKLDGNKCVCAYPYVGTDCEGCADGFKVKKRALSSSATVEHTICLADENSSKAACNGYGKLRSNKQSCECDSTHAGNFCEMCANMEYEYPDCSPESNSEVHNSESIRAYVERRDEEVEGGTVSMQQEETSVFQQQCQQSNYPTSLDSILDEKEFESTNFHYADTYLVSHDLLNVIDFTPTRKGIFKILVKQPELEDHAKTDEVFGLQIQVRREDAVIATYDNQQIQFDNLGAQKVDYTWAFFDVRAIHLLLPLTITFKVTNYTSTEETQFEKSCQLVYMEIEFRSDETYHKCDDSIVAIAPSTKVIELNPSEEIKATAQHARSVDKSDTKDFFYHQDYYVGMDGSKGYNLKVSLEQKFIDLRQIVPIIEILHSDEELSDINVRDYKALTMPQCKKKCYIAGHRSYNEFSTTAVVPAGTLFRVWLHQVALETFGVAQQPCTNFNFDVSARAVTKTDTSKALHETIRCDFMTYLPSSLNINRYLGDSEEIGKQQDFNYIENFRIDHLDKVMQTTFRLDERSMIRFSGPDYPKISYDMKLLKGRSNKLIDFESLTIDQNKRAGQNDVFTVLDPGEYTLKILFVTEEYVLNEPCQSIQLHLAISQMTTVQKEMVMPTKAINTQTLSLTKIMAPKEVGTPTNIYSTTPIVSRDADNQYQVLLKETFKFDQSKNMHLLIEASSDYLRLDISFILYGYDGRVIAPQVRTETTKKLLIENLHNGEYTIVIFSRKAFQAQGHQFEEEYFTFRMQLFSQEHTAPADINIKNNDKTFSKQHIQKEFAPLGEVLCLAQHHRLPNGLMRREFSQNYDQNFNYGVLAKDLVFNNKMTIEYEPQEEKDFLRVIAVGDVDIKMFKKKDYSFERKYENEDYLFESTRKAGHRQSHLIAEGLKYGTIYILELTFTNFDDMDTTTVVKESCVTGTLQIKAASSKEFKCLKSDQVGGTDFITLSNIANEQNIDVVSVSHHSSSGKKPAKLEKKDGRVVENKAFVKLESDYTDLEVSVDYSDSLYPAFIDLVYVKQSISEMGTNVQDYGDSERVERVETLEHAEAGILSTNPGVMIHKMDFTTSKHMQKVRFLELAKGTYEIRVSQPGMPEDCYSKVHVNLLPSEPLEKIFVKDFEKEGGQRVNGRFQSKLQDYGGIKRLPQQLPLNLNSMKFMEDVEGGYDSQYLLFSEILKLNEDETANVIKLEVKEKDTVVRIYYEDENLTLKMTKKGQEEAEKKENHQLNLRMLSLTLDVGSYVFKFEAFSWQKLKRQVNLGDTVQVTIMVATKSFVKKEYTEFHNKGLKNCEDSQFPLALNKQTLMNIDENQAYYHYPLLRTEQKGSDMYPQEHTTYYFRFNETQRFYYEVGSNFISNHMILEFAIMNGGQSWTLAGKQTGNLNVIDISVQPGDYQLKVLGYSSKVHECGMYSLSGLLQPDSAVAAKSINGEVLEGDTTCAKKGDHLPNVIYASPAKTRYGNEEFVSATGFYYKIFSDVLVVKSQREALEPWAHEIQIESPGSGLIQVLLQTKEAEYMNVRLTSALGGRQKPVLADQIDTTEGHKELSFSFQVNANVKYFLIIEQSGDMYAEDLLTQSCTYFNLIINLNTIDYLKKELSCEKVDPENKMPRLLDVLPGEITDKDVDFKIKDLYKLEYPKDFTLAGEKAQTQGDTKHALVIDTMINTKHTFDFSASLWFDLHKSDFIMGLYAYPDQDTLSSGDFDPASDLDQIATQTIAFEAFNDAEDVTLKRNLNHKNVHRKDSVGQPGKYMFVVQERHAAFMFGQVSMKHPEEKLCLPVGLKLSIKKKQQGVAAVASVPTLTRFQFVSDEMTDNGALRIGADTVLIEVEMTEEPDKQLLYTNFALRLMANDWSAMKYLPKNVEVDQLIQSYRVSLTYKISINQALGSSKDLDELYFTPSVSIDNLLTIDGKQFALSDRFVQQMEKQPLHVSIPDNLRVKKELREKSEGGQTRDSLIQNGDQEFEEYSIDDTVKVNCLCVHGTCKFGSSKCEKCLYGWTGTLCDQKKKKDGSFKKDGPLKDYTADSSRIVKTRPPEKKQKQKDTFAKGKTDYSSVFAATKITDVQVNESKHRGPNRDEETSAHRGSSREETVSTPTYTSMSDQVSTPQASKKQPEKMYSTVYRAPAKTGRHGGWLSSIFHSFVWIVEFIIKLLVLGFAIYLLKVVYDKVLESLHSASAKKRRRKKKQMDGETEFDADASGEEETELVEAVELKAINRKRQRMQGNFSDDEDDVEDPQSRLQRTRGRSNDHDQLELFDQDEEDPQMPQEADEVLIKKSAKGAPAAQARLQQEVDETTNEIDDALAQLEKGDGDGSWGALQTPKEQDTPGGDADSIGSDEFDQFI